MAEDPPPDYEALWRVERDKRAEAERRLAEVSFKAHLYQRVEAAAKSKFCGISTTLLSELEAEKRLRMDPLAAGPLAANLRTTVQRELLFPSDLQTVVIRLLNENDELRREAAAARHKHSAAVTSFKLEWRKRRGEHYDEVDVYRENIKGLEKSLTSVSKAQKALGRVRKWRGNFMYVRESMYCIRQELFNFNQYLSGYGGPTTTEVTAEEASISPSQSSASLLGVPTSTHRLGGVLGVVASAFEGLSMLQLNAEAANKDLNEALGRVEVAAKRALSEVELAASRSLTERSISAASSGRQASQSQAASTVSMRRLTLAKPIAIRGGILTSTTGSAISTTRRKSSASPRFINTSDAELGRMEHSFADDTVAILHDSRAASESIHPDEQVDPGIRAASTEGTILELLRIIKGLREVNTDLQEELVELRSPHRSEGNTSLYTKSAFGSARKVSSTGKSKSKGGTFSDGGASSFSKRIKSVSLASEDVAPRGKSPRAPESWSGTTETKPKVTSPRKSTVEVHSLSSVVDAILPAQVTRLPSTPRGDIDQIPSSPRLVTSPSLLSPRHGVLTPEQAEAIAACRVASPTTMPIAGCRDVGCQTTAHANSDQHTSTPLMPPSRSIETQTEMTHVSEHNTTARLPSQPPLPVPGTPTAPPPISIAPPSLLEPRTPGSQNGTPVKKETDSHDDTFTGLNRIPSLSEMLPTTADIAAYPAVPPSPSFSDDERDHGRLLRLHSLAVDAEPFLTKRLVMKIWLKKSVQRRAASLFKALDASGIGRTVSNRYRPSSAGSIRQSRPSRPNSASSKTTMPTTVSMHVGSYGTPKTNVTDSRRSSVEPQTRPWSAASRADPFMVVGLGATMSTPSRPSTATHRPSNPPGSTSMQRPFSAQSAPRGILKKPQPRPSFDLDDDGFVQEDSEPTPRGHNGDSSPTSTAITFAQGAPRAVVALQRGARPRANDSLPNLDDLEAFHDAYIQRTRTVPK